MVEPTPHLASECRVCGSALAGAGGAVLRLVGIRRSARNPNVCTRCNTHIQAGEIREVTVLFADLSGFTALTHELGPEATHAIVDAFLQSASTAVTGEDGSVDKFIGDAIMAVFNEPIVREDHAAAAFRAALAIQAAMPELSERFGRPLRVTVGLACGHARVGPIGGRDATPTLLGDVVNLAARLQAQARPGEILVDEGVYQAVQGAMGEVLEERLVLKGFTDPVAARRFGPEGMLPPTTDVKPRRRVRLFGLGSVALALLGAPCVGAAALSSLSLWVGAAGAAAAGGAGAVSGLDHPWVSGPLRLVALLIAGINLAAMVQVVRQRRNRGIGRVLPMGALDRKRLAWALGWFLLTIALAVGEWVFHHRMHPEG